MTTTFNELKMGSSKILGATLLAKVSENSHSACFLGAYSSCGSTKVFLRVRNPDSSIDTVTHRSDAIREITSNDSSMIQHLPKVLASGRDVESGFDAIVIEAVDGKLLSRSMHDFNEKPVEVVRLISKLLELLSKVHAAGVVMHNLHPGNIVLRKPEGSIVLPDFDYSSIGGKFASNFKPAIYGTPGYMAPEQINGYVADQRADIYSVGAIAYELLSGVNPFVSELSPSNSVANHQTLHPRSLTSFTNLTVPLASFVMKCLEKKPSDRFDSAIEALNVLVHILSKNGITESNKSYAIEPIRPDAM